MNLYLEESCGIRLNEVVYTGHIARNCWSYAPGCRRAILLLMAILLLAPLALFGQDDMPSDVHQASSYPPNGRYQIVQSELAAKWTFRLDRFAGKVDQLASAADGRDVWQSVPVDPKPVIAQPTHPRFQIFTSGIAARFTFLIDTDTGVTWQLVSSDKTAPDGTKYTVYSWQLIEG